MIVECFKLSKLPKTSAMDRKHDEDSRNLSPERQIMSDLETIVSLSKLLTKKDC